MSISVSYNLHSKYMLVVLEGEVNNSDIEANRAKVIDLSKQHHCFNVIADLRSASNQLSLGEIFWQAAATAKKMREEGLKYPAFKRALVVNKGDSKAEFFDLVANNRGRKVELFENLEDAETWLEKE